MKPNAAEVAANIRALAVVLEAAAWHAHGVEETAARWRYRGAKAQVTTIRRAIRQLAPSEAQRDRLLAIARPAKPGKRRSV